MGAVGVASVGRCRTACCVLTWHHTRSPTASRVANQPTGSGSTLRGATYAVSDVTLSATQILSWDRGYDAQDNQVWGAEAGPYEFLRQ